MAPKEAKPIAEAMSISSSWSEAGVGEVIAACWSGEVRVGSWSDVSKGWLTDRWEVGEGSGFRMEDLRLFGKKCEGLGPAFGRLGSSAYTFFELHCHHVLRSNGLNASLNELGLCHCYATMPMKIHAEIHLTELSPSLCTTLFKMILFLQSHAC